MYFNESGLVFQVFKGRELFIPWTYIHKIYKGLKAGKQYNFASPVVNITREQAGFILAEYPTIIERQ